MAAPALEVVVPELVMAFVNLLFTYYRLERLTDMVERQYDLADRQTKLAELLYSLHKVLRQRDPELFGIVNASPLYTQRYDCAVTRATVNIARSIVGKRQTALRATSAYHQGQMRNINQTTTNALLATGMPRQLDAYKLEDAQTDIAVARRFTNLVNSIATRFFSPGRVYAGLGAYYTHMTGVTARAAERSAVVGLYELGSAYENFIGPREQKKVKSTQVVSGLEPEGGPGETLPPSVLQERTGTDLLRDLGLTVTPTAEPVVAPTESVVPWWQETPSSTLSAGEEE